MDVDLSRVQTMLDWIKTKIFLDNKARVSRNPNIRNVYRGQVYRCAFGVGVGSEQEKSDRPCVIIQNYNGNRNSPNTIVAPISHSTSTLPIVVPVTPQMNADGTVKLDGCALLGNMTTVSKARLGDYITKLSGTDMKKIDKAAAVSLELYTYYNDLEKRLDRQDVYIEQLKITRNKYQDQLTSIYEIMGVSDYEQCIEEIKKM